VLLSLSKVVNLSSLFGFWQHTCCNANASRWSSGQPKLSLPSLRSMPSLCLWLPARLSCVLFWRAGKLNMECPSSLSPKECLVLYSLTYAMSLFLASTVSALHRNAHIWNASHPLLVTYYCWVTMYSPGMEVKKTNCIFRCLPESNLDFTDPKFNGMPSMPLEQTYLMGRSVLKRE